MSEQRSEARSIVQLPGNVKPPIRVWLNGVEQQEGRDFMRHNDRLYFDQHLQKEGRLGPWRWLSMLFGIAGTYRQNDSVDIQYEAGGQTRHVTGLDFIKPVDSESTGRRD